MAVHEISSGDFAEKISKGKVLIKYEADWCGPCRMITPVIEELSNEMKDIKFYKLDVDQSPDVASQYDVMGIPTLILFNNGKEVKRIVGLRSKDDLKRELR